MATGVGVGVGGAGVLMSVGVGVRPAGVCWLPAGVECWLPPGGAGLLAVGVGSGGAGVGLSALAVSVGDGEPAWVAARAVPAGVAVGPPAYSATLVVGVVEAASWAGRTDTLHAASSSATAAALIQPTGPIQGR